MIHVMLMAGFIALQGAEVHPVSGPPIKDATVLIYGDKVINVGRKIQVPRNASRIDVSGKVITPGLIHAGSRLGLVEVFQVASTVEGKLENNDNHRKVRAAFRVVDELNPASSLIPIARAEGITSALVMPSGGVISGQAAWIHTNGNTTDEMVVRSPVALTASVGDARGAAGGRGGMWLTLRELFDDAKQYDARRKSFEQRRTRDFAAHRLDLEAMLPVLRREIPLILHADRASDIRTAIRFAKRYRIRLIIAGATEGWLVADDLAEARVPVIVHVPKNLPSSFDGLAARLDNPARLARAGVKIAIVPGDWAGNAHTARRLRQEAANCVVEGLSREDALKAITRNPAEMFNLRSRTGTITRGAPADLVIWSGDPFFVESRAERIFIKGAEVSTDSRQMRLLERYKQLPTTSGSAAAR